MKDEQAIDFIAEKVLEKLMKNDRILVEGREYNERGYVTHTQEIQVLDTITTAVLQKLLNKFSDEKNSFIRKLESEVKDIVNSKLKEYFDTDNVVKKLDINVDKMVDNYIKNTLSDSLHRKVAEAVGKSSYYNQEEVLTNYIEEEVNRYLRNEVYNTIRAKIKDLPIDSIIDKLISKVGE